MMLSKYRLVFIALIGLILSACSPHPGTGVWHTSADNEFGVSEIIVAFEGKAQFTSNKPVSSSWHCFWGKETDMSLNLDCSPSSDLSKARQFRIIAKDKMTAEFKEGDKLIAILNRIDANPVLPEK